MYLLNINDLDFRIMLASKVSCIDLSICHTRYEIPHSTKLLRIAFGKINGCVIGYDGSKCITLVPFNEQEKNILKNLKKCRIKCIN